MTPDPRPADERDSISHLTAVVRGKRQPNALSSLENNVIVTEILEAARRVGEDGPEDHTEDSMRRPLLITCVSSSVIRSARSGRS